MNANPETFRLMREANLALLENLRLFRLLVGEGDIFFELANLAPSHLTDLQVQADSHPDAVVKQPLKDYLAIYKEVIEGEIAHLADRRLIESYIPLSDPQTLASLERVFQAFRNKRNPAPIWVIIFVYVLRCLRDNDAKFPEWIGFNIELPQHRRQYRVAHTVNLTPFPANTFSSRYRDLPISRYDYRFARRAGDYFPQEIINDAPSVGNLLFFDTHVDQDNAGPHYSGVPILLSAYDSSAEKVSPNTQFLEIHYEIDVASWRDATDVKQDLKPGVKKIYAPLDPPTMCGLAGFFEEFVERWIASRAQGDALHRYFGTVLPYLTQENKIPTTGFSLVSVPSVFWSIDKSIQGAASALNFCFHERPGTQELDLLVAFSQSILQGVGHLARLQDTKDLGAINQREKTFSIFAHETRYIIPAIDSRKLPPKALDLVRRYFEVTFETEHESHPASAYEGVASLKALCWQSAEMAWQMVAVRPYIRLVERGEVEATDTAFDKFIERRVQLLQERFSSSSLDENIRISPHFKTAALGALNAAFRNALFHSYSQCNFNFTLRVFIDESDKRNDSFLLVLENTVTALSAPSRATEGKANGTLQVIRHHVTKCGLDPSKVRLSRRELTNTYPFSEVWQTVVPIPFIVDASQ